MACPVCQPPTRAWHSAMPVFFLYHLHRTAVPPKVKWSANDRCNFAHEKAFKQQQLVTPHMDRMVDRSGALDGYRKCFGVGFIACTVMVVVWIGFRWERQKKLKLLWQLDAIYGAKSECAFIALTHKFGEACVHKSHGQLEGLSLLLRQLIWYGCIARCIEFQIRNILLKAIWVTRFLVSWIVWLFMANSATV